MVCFYLKLTAYQIVIKFLTCPSHRQCLFFYHGVSGLRLCQLSRCILNRLPITIAVQLQQRSTHGQLATVRCDPVFLVQIERTKHWAVRQRHLDALKGLFLVCSPYPFRPGSRNAVQWNGQGCQLRTELAEVVHHAQKPSGLLLCSWRAHLTDHLDFIGVWFDSRLTDQVSQEFDLPGTEFTLFLSQRNPCFPYSLQHCSQP